MHTHKHEDFYLHLGFSCFPMRPLICNLECVSNEIRLGA